jgi:hypothetical protein
VLSSLLRCWEWPHTAASAASAGVVAAAACGGSAASASRTNRSPAECGLKICRRLVEFVERVLDGLEARLHGVDGTSEVSAESGCVSHSLSQLLRNGDRWSAGNGSQAAHRETFQATCYGIVYRSHAGIGTCRSLSSAAGIRVPSPAELPVVVGGIGSARAGPAGPRVGWRRRNDEWMRVRRDVELRAAERKQLLLRRLARILDGDPQRADVPDSGGGTHVQVVTGERDTLETVGDDLPDCGP